MKKIILRSMHTPEVSPVQTTIDTLVNKYLEEVVQHFQPAFDLEGFFKALDDAGILPLHQDFIEKCRRYSELVSEVNKQTKKSTVDIMHILEIDAELKKLNFLLVEILERLSDAMRLGQTWRNSLDGVGLAENVDRWLSYWDENLPEAEKLKRNSAG
jgi:hypothetical protein